MSHSPQQVADTLRELTQITLQRSPPVNRSPRVTIYLDLLSDRLGVRVLFDNEIQEPAPYGEYSQISVRTLDNLFLKILDEHGIWDEHAKLWYLNDSKDIAWVLGLLPEFAEVLSLENSKAITIVTQPLHACLRVHWLASGAELDMRWLLPHRDRRPNEGQLLGNPPSWAVIDNCIYPLAPAAAKIASLFPSCSSITLTRNQIGHLLEVLNNDQYDPELIEIHNPQLQPASQVKSPTPVLKLRRKTPSFEHFASLNKLELEAVLDFEYPLPPSDQNVVYLPDRSAEQEAADFMTSLGFQYHGSSHCYTLAEELALDLISKQTTPFPVEWRVVGLEELKRMVHIADLNITINLTPSSDDHRQLPATKKGSIISAPKWFNCQLSLLLNNANVPLSTIFKNSHADNDRWLRLDNGSYARVPGGNFAQLKTLLGMLDPSFRLNNTIATHLSLAQAISLARMSDPHILVKQDKSVRQIRRMLDNFEGVKALKAGRNFKGKLRPYQEDGLGWLYFLHQFGFCGILADEMGLGKTVQTLALFQKLKEQAQRQKRKLKPSLVIAPTSVITNWAYEARRFTPKLTVLLLHGPRRKDNFTLIEESDLVITSYALLRLDRYELEKYEFNYIVLDEAQLIKNFQAATTLAAKSLRSERRLALTGTPTENRPLELWSIMDFLMPGYLGTAEFFRNCLEKPILEGGPTVPAAVYLKTRTRPFIMRRTKSQVEKELPAKVESILHVAMSDSQAELYSQVLSEVRQRVLEAVARKGVAGASVSILTALMRLRQVCNHPNSVKALCAAPGYESGKFNLLKDLLQEALQAGRKILLFCQFIDMLAIIRRHLEKSGITYLYLDGATPKRQELIDRFNDDERIRLFLISLKAGGLGLNLTAADTVIIYDPWWNPAIENQAIDRAHRIGQRRTVNVYRLVTENSIEQKIMNLKKKKSALVEALINENGLSTLSLTKSEIENLFSPA